MNRTAKRKINLFAWFDQQAAAGAGSRAGFVALAAEAAQRGWPVDITARRRA